MEQVSQVGGIAGIIALLLHGIQQIIAVINHKRIHSECCGKNLGDTVIDINSTTPPPLTKISPPS